MAERFADREKAFDPKPNLEERLKPYPELRACTSYCTLSRFDSGRSTAATPFDNRDTSEWLIERIAAAIAIDTPQQTRPRPLMHGRFGDSQGLAHLFRRQQALFTQPAEPALEMIDHTNMHDLL